MMRFQRENMRGGDLHPDVCRPHARPFASMVQHGDLWQSREADCPPTSVEGVALSASGGWHHQNLCIASISGPSSQRFDRPHSSTPPSICICRASLPSARTARAPSSSASLFSDEKRSSGTCTPYNSAATKDPITSTGSAAPRMMAAGECAAPRGLNQRARRRG